MFRTEGIIRALIEIGFKTFPYLVMIPVSVLTTHPLTQVLGFIGSLVVWFGGRIHVSEMWDTPYDSAVIVVPLISFSRREQIGTWEVFSDISLGVCLWSFTVVVLDVVVRRLRDT